MSFRKFARARPRRQPGQMNKTEAAYAAYLELLHRSGEILSYGFESIKVKLADRTFYTPDFFVVRNDGTMEMHEVKGYWEDDARVKIKVAAEQNWWFKFVAVTAKAKKLGGGWNVEEF